MLGNNIPLSPAAVKRLEAAPQNGVILLPAICIWEVGLLVRKGRIMLSDPPAIWVHHALATPGLQLAPLTPEIALEASTLPGSFHADPADRLIVATARMEEATLLTRDRLILEYGRAGHVKTLAA